jgi:hypothetical protein
MGALIGLGVLGGTAIAFWRILPRGGKIHPLVGTQWEPYFAILFVFGVALGGGLVVGWVVDNFVK